jgi:hypothetical protein
LESHHGGSEEKFRAFMRTITLSADCPEIVVKRWRDLNNFKFDEDNMLLLTKLICSERVIKSRALLIDFIKSTLDFEVVEEENLQDGANLMAPTKKGKNHRYQMLKTPVKNPRKIKADPKAYELAYR